MRSVSISDLKARLSAFLYIVRDGGEVLVTERGRPMARLIAIRGNEHEDAQLELLLRSGRLRAPSGALAPDFWTRPRPLDVDWRSLAAVLEEREGGR
jgi:prevent-host-death family protein